MLNTNMNSCILYPDMLEPWYSALKLCEGTISKLTETLMVENGDMKVCERIKWVVWNRWSSERLIQELKNEMGTLRQLDEVYFFHRRLGMVQN